MGPGPAKGLLGTGGNLRASPYLGRALRGRQPAASAQSAEGLLGRFGRTPVSAPSAKTCVIGTGCHLAEAPPAPREAASRRAVTFTHPRTSVERYVGDNLRHLHNPCEASSEAFDRGWSPLGGGQRSALPQGPPHTRTTRTCPGGLHICPSARLIVALTTRAPCRTGPALPARKRARPESRRHGLLCGRRALRGALDALGRCHGYGRRAPAASHLAGGGGQGHQLDPHVPPRKHR